MPSPPEQSVPMNIARTTCLLGSVLALRFWVNGAAESQRSSSEERNLV